ncbi:bifunctional diaminohydroxyphosphoribosylaminopyrimidine deaminase/5-amino-6-(5-phosphoribosylamino)uracil reductase RibD [Pseudenhygromyxa sp. WMMC2535]|uniref:bifunctional diaminohydroxyphosphoribosylaminopyrimidine deaminase/5-amino-6-(5-phosphoribosylamino)uracil reductase RibD n=1 Tax=Pseudenhygromyxa sp. WMMC2535 TaxID=2712867 RepID=UPI001556C704|nr:bifunctional diaminohydroxyphosphoribosylaminopyrimidine deaminase/5-amino-6-(5-phosphoribosylamino)uracil reductase RibD [Pseudenhygromyxa sp. WMMC2535]NVB41648.1 bifunctional diaminohydroxyphosphoribosylaminopyrimidine deaminase/5-amino-6-(5-phosphoribosylamino)uracil reductase RibD [Pseudenhygromyxa sp. WMMC2535]
MSASAKQASDRAFMRQAIRLARSGTGATYPNPCVGAVVVSRGEVVGKARSDVTGGPHAEVRALNQAGTRAREATLYVTLEPCSHRGRTPPCVDAILAAGISRVLVGVEDPAPHVAGAGVARLRKAGVEVEVGLLGEQVRELHAHYLHHVATGRPFVTLKLATSIDGRIATAAGDSKWITGEPARRSAHRLRALHHAVAVGAQTVIADDPRLDVRLARGRDPLPVVFDSRLRVASAGRPFNLLRAGVLFLHTPRASKRARLALERSGAEGLELPADADGRIDIEAAVERLGARELRSIMVEGGGQLLGSFVRAGAWQELWHYRAPLILGEGRPGFAGLSWPTVAEAPRLRALRQQRLGEDTLTVYAPG